jgi:hypothetical protein
MRNMTVRFKVMKHSSCGAILAESKICSSTVSIQILCCQYWNTEYPCLCRYLSLYYYVTFVTFPRCQSFWSSGRCSCVVFGRSQIKILAHRLAALTQDFCGFHHYLQALPSTLFQDRYLLSFLLFGKCSELLTALFSKS